MSSNDEKTRARPGSDRQSESEVGDLLQKAGRRPSMPSKRHARVEAAARSAWEEMVASGDERQTRSGRPTALALAAALALAILTGWIWLSSRSVPSTSTVATVELEVGAEAIASLESLARETFDIEVGEALDEGVRLTTAGGEGGGGRLALRMAGGEAVRLDVGTRVQLLSSSRIELESGAVYVDSGVVGRTASPLEVATPLGVVHHVGTQYEVRLGDGLGTVLVRVREGTVSVRNNGDSWAAGGGEELTLLADGSVGRADVKDADIWLWTLAAVPGIEIEGMKLDAFLRWVVHETGWRLEYEDEALAMKAAEIDLHGGIEGLRPDESVGVIVAGSGLVHQVEDGVLRISRP